MVYTTNVPLATQTIANSQPQILGNFQFLEDSIGQEHNFDATDPTKTYHLQASMPNSALSPSLGTTNGVYFVNSGTAQFYDGFDNYQLNVWTGVLYGTFNTPGNSGNFTIVAGIPDETFGVVYTFGNNPRLASSHQFYCTGNKVKGFTNRVIINSDSTQNPIELSNNPATSNEIRAFCDSSNYQSKTFNYIVFYRTV